MNEVSYRSYPQHGGFLQHDSLRPVNTERSNEEQIRFLIENQILLISQAQLVDVNAADKARIIKELAEALHKLMQSLRLGDEMNGGKQ